MAGDGGTAAVPDLATLPEPVRAVVADVYGQAAAELFLVGAPITALAVLAVLFIKEKPLHTLSGEERRAQEEAATGHPAALNPARRRGLDRGPFLRPRAART